jgi:uncharacterized protein YndB with AHSA1/START domain
VIIIYPIVYVLLFVLAFLLLAYAAPRRYQVKVTRTVAAPPERVWAYLSDPERFPHWFPGVAACTHAGGPERGVGQRRHVVLDIKGHPGEREEEATHWEENLRLELTHLSETRSGRPVRWEEARAEFRLAPAPGGTAVTAVLWFSGRGALGRMIALLSTRKRHEADFRAALERLDQRLREESFPP